MKSEIKMKHDMITQRLKGLIQNLSEAVDKKVIKYHHSENKFASSVYQIFLHEIRYTHWVLTLTFRTESEDGTVLPIDEQSVYFGLKHQSKDGEVIQAFRSSFLDLNAARSILKKGNKAINNAKANNEELKPDQLIHLVRQEIINASPNLQEGNESLFIDFAESMKDEVIQSKNNYLEAKKLKEEEEAKTKSDIENSDEYKLVSSLQRQLREAQSSLNKKMNDVKEENNSFALYTNREETSKLMIDKANFFYTACVKKLRDLELPFSLYKKYKDVSNHKKIL